jgi:SpoIID/LytB domain protein
VWTSASPIPYLQGVPVPEQSSPFAEWRYELPLAVFLDILDRDGIEVDAPVEKIRTIKTDHGEGPYRLKIRHQGGTDFHSMNDIMVALNRHTIRHYPEYVPSLLKGVNRAAPSPTFIVKLRSDGLVVVKGGGWGHQIGLGQYGARALAEDGATGAEILSHFYTGLTPESDPGFIPDEIDVGLAYDSLTRVIVLEPQEGYELSSSKGRVRIGEDDALTLTRFGNDRVALQLEG